jgi:hypothetical protein
MVLIFELDREALNNIGTKEKGRPRYMSVQTSLHSSPAWTYLLQSRERAYFLRNCQVRENLFAASAYDHHA